jgi:hypothetical protein
LDKADGNKNQWFPNELGMATTYILMVAISDSQSYRVANELNSSTVGSTRGTANKTSNQVFDSVTLQPLAFFHSEVPAAKEPDRFFANSPLSHAQHHTADPPCKIQEHSRRPHLSSPSQAQVHRQTLGFPDKAFIRMKTEGQDAILQ